MPEATLPFLMNADPANENLDGLIQKIQSEGVEAGERARAAIIQRAEAEARRIIEQAQAEADRIGRENSDRLRREEAAAAASIRRAARDVQVALRGSLREILALVVQERCAAGFDDGFLRELISQVAIEWIRRDGTGNLEIFTNDTDQRRLTDTFVAELGKSLGAGVVIKTHPSVQHGFRIGGEDDPMQFDFSDAAIAEAICLFLNPRLAKLLQESEPGKDA